MTQGCVTLLKKRKRKVSLMYHVQNLFPIVKAGAEIWNAPQNITECQPNISSYCKNGKKSNFVNIGTVIKLRSENLITVDKKCSQRQCMLTGIVQFRYLH